MDLELTHTQACAILDELCKNESCEDFFLHLEDLMIDRKNTYEVEVLTHEIEPLYIALAGHKDLTVPVTLLRAALVDDSDVDF